MKKSLKGALLLALGLVLFVAYWAVLLGPIQNSYAGTKTYPNIVICLIAAIVVGAAVSTLTFVGNALTKDKAFGIEHTNPSLAELKKAKAFGLWAIIWVVATTLGTIAWRGDL